MYVTRISRYIYIYIYIYIYTHIYSVRYYPRFHVTAVGLGYGGPPVYSVLYAAIVLFDVIQTEQHKLYSCTSEVRNSHNGPDEAHCRLGS